jgi:hypothetical protein
MVQGMTSRKGIGAIVSAQWGGEDERQIDAATACLLKKYDGHS